MRKGYIMIFTTLWVIGVIVVMGIMLFNFISNFTNNNNQKNINISEKSENNVNENLNENIEIVTTSAKKEEKDTIYIIKEYNGKIAIYVLEDDGKEYLRETTEIVTKYLPDLDRKKLEIGIRVTGKEELNKVLEDYE